MQENQEQKSPSEDTIQAEEKPEKKPLPEIKTEALAVAYRSIVPFDYNELRELFDEYWEMSGHLIEQRFKFKGRKKGKNKSSKHGKEYLEKTVGYNKLYGEVLWHLASEKLNKPMFFTTLSLEKFDPESTFAVAVYYKYPKLNLMEDIDFNIERKVDYDKEKAWDKRCKELQTQYRTFTPYEGDGCINETQQVLLDLVANCEGKPYPHATSQGKWFDVDNIAITTLKEALLTHKRDDLFEVSFVNEEDKQVDIQVKVHGVNGIQIPEIDDELAKDAGFDDLSTLQVQFYEEYEKYIRGAEESIACDHILTDILTKSEIGPVPNDYIKVNVEQSIKQFIANHNGNKEKAMRSISASSEENMRQLFVGQVHRDLYQKLARDFYATKYGIDKEDTDSILKHMRDSAKWFVKQNEQDKV